MFDSVKSTFELVCFVHEASCVENRSDHSQFRADDAETMRVPSHPRQPTRDRWSMVTWNGALYFPFFYFCLFSSSFRAAELMQ